MSMINAKPHQHQHHHHHALAADPVSSYAAISSSTANINNVLLSSDGVDLLKPLPTPQIRANLISLEMAFTQRLVLRVSGIRAATTEESFREFLSRQFNLHPRRLSLDRPARSNGDMTGIVVFATVSEFDAAMSYLPGAVYGGKPLQAVHPQSEGLLFVGNLDFGYSEQEFLKLCEQHGVVVRCFIVRDSATGLSKGYGCVEFATRSQASDAKTQLSAKVVCGRAIRIDWIDTVSASQTLESLHSRTLFIDRLPKQFRNIQAIKELCYKYGTVTFSRIAISDGVSRGFAFVDFATSDEAANAFRHVYNAQVDGMSFRVSFGNPCKTGEQILNKPEANKKAAATRAQELAQPAPQPSLVRQLRPQVESMRIPLGMRGSPPFLGGPPGPINYAAPPHSGGFVVPDPRTMELNKRKREENLAAQALQAFGEQQFMQQPPFGNAYSMPAPPASSAPTPLAFDHMHPGYSYDAPDLSSAALFPPYGLVPPHHAMLDHLPPYNYAPYPTAPTPPFLPSAPTPPQGAVAYALPSGILDGPYSEEPATSEHSEPPSAASYISASLGSFDSQAFFYPPAETTQTDKENLPLYKRCMVRNPPAQPECSSAASSSCASSSCASTPVVLRYEKPLTLTPGHQALTNEPILTQFTSPPTFFATSVKGRAGPVESVPFAKITDGHVPYIPQAFQGLADGGLLEACKRKRT